MADAVPLSIVTTPQVPVEVCERIIEFLFTEFYSEVSTALATLSNCALVCSDWRPRAQRVLFEYVTLRDKDALYRFAELLDASPKLGSYVRMLALRGYLHVPFSPFVLLPTVLRGRLTHLRELSILGVDSKERAANPLPEGKKELQSLPIHQLYPSLLTSISRVHRLDLVNVTFPSFGDFARILDTFSSLEHLFCRHLTWAVLGQEPTCLAKTHPGPYGSRNGFLPNLQWLQCYDMEEHGRQRFISALGPSVLKLWLKFPNTPPSILPPDQRERLEDKASGTPLPLDLKSVPSLRDLTVSLAGPLPPEAHLTMQSLRYTLASWTTSDDSSVSSHVCALRDRYLYLEASWRANFTRRDYAHLLGVVGPVVEAALRVEHALHQVRADGEEEPGSQADLFQARLVVDDLGDRDEWEDWWWEQASECFPTFAKWKHLTVQLSTDFPGDCWKDYHESPRDPPGGTPCSQPIPDGHPVQKHAKGKD